MNVLLLRPPRRDIWDMGLSVPPMGLAYLAASLLQANHNVQILDAYALRWNSEQFHKWIQQKHFDVIGLTAMTPTMDIVARAVEVCRPFADYIIVGGPHPTAVREDIFSELPLIDAAFVGEAEESIVAWMSYIAGKNSFPAGVLMRGMDFVAAQPPNIHTLPMPARHLLPNHAYRYLFSSHPSIGTMISSRGCPFRCSFCDKSVGGSRWRARTPKEVVDELSHMKTELGIGFVNFYDDNFTLHRSRVVEICNEILRRNLTIDWKCEGRVDGVDLELLQLMKKAGCKTVAYGVESGNAQSLALLRKDVSIEKSRKAFRDTKKAGLRSLAYMILGVPGESVDDVYASIRFCRELGADYVQFSSLTAMPGTDISAQFSSEVSVKNPLDRDQSRATITDLPVEDLNRLMREAWMGFYLRPKPLWRLSVDGWKSGAWREGIHLAVGMGRWALRS